MVRVGNARANAIITDPTSGLQATVFTPSDGGGAQPGIATTAVPLYVNTVGSGGSYSRARGQTGDTVLAQAARTAATQSATWANINSRGGFLILGVTAASGTGGLTVTLQMQDPVTGAWISLHANPTAVIATGEFVYEIGPGIGAASGGVTQRTSGQLGQTLRVNVAVGDASSYTYSVVFVGVP